MDCPSASIGGVAVHPFRSGIPRGDHARQILADDRVVGVLDDVRQPEGQFVGGFPIRDITGEAARVKELIVTPQHVRIDQDVANGPVLPAKAGFVVLQCFAARQASEDVPDDRLVDVELRDVVSDVLVAGVTQKVQFGLVGPQDRAVRPDPMQPFSGMIEALFQFLIDALGDFLFKGGRGVRRLGVIRAVWRSWVASGQIGAERRNLSASILSKTRRSIKRSTVASSTVG